MNHVRLLNRLDQVARRFRQLRFWQSLAVVWLLKPTEARPLPLLCAATIVWAAAASFLSLRSARSRHRIAQRVEAAFPELHTCLLAALEQQPELPNGRFGYLQGRVINQALDHSRKHDWPQLVSSGQLALAGAANVVCARINPP